MINKRETEINLATMVFHRPATLYPPFEEEHTWIYQFLRKVCGCNNSTNSGQDQVIIAGSSALDQYTRRHMGFSIEPRDVDFFTTLEIDDEEMNWLMYKMMRCQDAFRIRADRVPYMGRLDNYPLTINGVWNFTIRYFCNDGTLLEPIPLPMQLICLYIPPIVPFPATIENFTDIVLQRFDLSICKCAILNDTLMDIYVVDENEIEMLRMTYDMRKFRGSDAMKSRLWKYLDRGFILSRIQITETSFVEAGHGFLQTFDIEDDGSTVTPVHNIVEHDEHV